MTMDEQLKKLRADFKLYGVKADTAVGEAMIKCAILVEGQAAELAPVDTGLLRKSINHRVRKTSGGYIGEVGTNVEYAAFQEFGTSRMEPQPFLTPALKMNQTKINQILAAAIRKAAK